jgi:hypothetical protein
MPGHLYRRSPSERAPRPGRNDKQKHFDGSNPSRRRLLQQNLPEADKVGLSEKKAIALMLRWPSMIKRPVLDTGGKLIVGFDPATYATALR